MAEQANGRCYPNATFPDLHPLSSRSPSAKPQWKAQWKHHWKPQWKLLVSIPTLPSSFSSCQVNPGAPGKICSSVAYEGMEYLDPLAGSGRSM